MCEHVVFLSAAEAYNSELFLDCCGLVRWVLKDLKEEFGFTTGPWNQAYQVNTNIGSQRCLEVGLIIPPPIPL